MERFVRIVIPLLAAGVAVGIGLRQAGVDRRARHSESRCPFGAGTIRLEGPRGFWIGLAESDSLSCCREISALESLIEVIPDYAPAHRALALAYACAGSSEKALRAGERYAELSPGEPETDLLLASVYTRAGSYDAALDALERAERSGGSPCWIEGMRGELFSAKGMYGRAIESYRRLVDEAPYEMIRSDALFEMGRAYLARGRLREAGACFDQSAYPDSLDPRAAWGKGLVLAAEGRPGPARERAERVRPAADDSTLISPGAFEFLMGRILMAEKRWEEAALFLEVSAERSPVPDRLRSLVALADAYRLAGRRPEARGCLDRCLHVNPSCAEARYSSARLREEEEGIEAARADYEAFLEIWADADPDLPMVTDARRRLATRPRALP